MQLTDFTDHSLRVLIHLNQTKENTTLSDLAKTLKISRNSLIKISNKLEKLGFISTTPGRYGGLKIEEKTASLPLGVLVKNLEARFYLAECFSKGPVRCTLKNRCLLKGYLHEAFSAFLASLDRHTLNDITPKLSEI